MYAAERQLFLTEMLERHGRVAVNEVAHHLKVSTETIRRDLTVLERAGTARRVHGGAVLSSAYSRIEPSLSQRTSERPDLKARIAAAALAFLPPAGGSVLLDGGSTVAHLVAALPADLRLTVLTHSVAIAHQLLGHEGIALHTIGGRVRDVTGVAVGQRTVETLASTRADVAFLGTNGITADHGFSTPDSDEAAVKRALVGSARTRVVLADSTKFGPHQVFSFADLDQVTVVVTDDGIRAQDRAMLHEAGVDVVVA
ncbi:DeoR/GlpR family DNA-binding transcription regulator [Aeromicrobium duanguangcaii]|uniref:Lactose phosphotransferase system repressor n=1 Tax=Aeromicrobium duanguangcaii TaxID=2968086 RepID=A0ABY5KFF5_9ACTN|nr:DeoR/GlpR family DNA-binding transcription regulator [Aeromicrobium duanguangcaii]UUI69196.1 DeoR/GlpR family DNA-binding transcription regulator [Aeromicrobium duanguangcaii]